jgi:hypothetical protein
VAKPSVSKGRKTRQKTNRAPPPAKPKKGNGAGKPEQAPGPVLSPEAAAFLASQKADAAVLRQPAKLVLGLSSETEEGANLHALIRTVCAGGCTGSPTLAGGALMAIETQAEALITAVNQYYIMKQMQTEPFDLLIRSLHDISGRARCAAEIARRTVEAIEESEVAS